MRADIEAYIEFMCRALCEASGENPDEPLSLPRPHYITGEMTIPRWRTHHGFCYDEYRRAVAREALTRVLENEAEKRARKAEELARAHGWKAPHEERGWQPK